MKVDQQLKESYDKQYDDSLTDWRMVSARYKAENVRDLAAHLKPGKVVEVGCGEGSILYWLDQFAFSKELYGLDISKSGVAQTQKKNIPSLVDVKEFDGYVIPYPDNYFDLAICSHVIEHVEDPRTIIREIKRVSKHQFYEVPTDFSFFVDRKLDFFLSYGHLNVYTPALFRYLLFSEGHAMIGDKFNFLGKDVFPYTFKSKPKQWAYQIKTMLLKLTGLHRVKPTAYSILVDKSRKVKIMDH